MINLLLFVIFSEMGLIILLLFKTPLRKLVIIGLDRLKRSRGPLMVKSVAATIVVVLISTVYSIVKIQNRGIENEAVNPTDQVLLARHLLEATLMGIILLLLSFLLSENKLYFYEIKAFEQHHLMTRSK